MSGGLCGFELVPRGAARRVALHDGDDAADDAPAALSFVKDDALYGLPQPLVGFLFWCSLVQLCDHSEVMIAQMFGLSRGEGPEYIKTMSCHSKDAVAQFAQFFKCAILGQSKANRLFA